MPKKRMTEPRGLRAKLEWGWGPLALGHVPELTEEFLAHSRRAAKLVELLWDDDDGVASRAADILERITRGREADLDPYLALLLAENKEALLGLMPEAGPKKLRWNLALMLGRLPLTDAEARRAAAVLESWLRDPSSIMKTAALQGLADLIGHSPALKPTVLDLLHSVGRGGTAAMRARSRLLLKKLEKSGRG
jgi:hypothetical protein